MGLIRKTMSAGTLGAVDWRSDKERTARYTRQTRDAARSAAKAQRSTARAVQHSGPSLSSRLFAKAEVPDFPLAPQQVTQGPPPGWYPDAADPRWQRWWDGVQWTEHLQQAPWNG